MSNAHCYCRTQFLPSCLQFCHEICENVRRACGRVSKGVYLGRGRSEEGTFRGGQVNMLLKEKAPPRYNQPNWTTTLLLSVPLVKRWKVFPLQWLDTTFPTVKKATNGVGAAHSQWYGQAWQGWWSGISLPICFIPSLLMYDYYYVQSWFISRYLDHQLNWVGSKGLDSPNLLCISSFA